MTGMWPCLPPLKLREDVEGILRQTYVRGQDGRLEGEDNDASTRLTAALQRLGTPPLYTTLRMNTLAESPDRIRSLVQEELDKQCQLHEQEPFVVSQHPILDDVLCVRNRAHPDLIPEEREVIVDLACGMAVLRGADVFVQGIMGAPSGMHAGDKVAVFADVEGRCRRGLTQRFHGNKVFVGNGVAQIGRDDLYRAQEPLSGVGILMTRPVCQAPSLADLLPALVFPQNLPSALTAHVLSPQPGETILDMCAAPGGKTTHIGTLMKNEGHVVALDKTEAKVERVRQAAARWGLTSVHCFACDGRSCLDKAADESGGPPYPPESFDRVLLDGPCSALGQRPVSLNKMSPAQLTSYSNLQRALFNTAVGLLRRGGVLVYSTCTITLEENEDTVAWALAHHPCLELAPQEPQLGGSGFLVAGLTEEDVCKLQRFEPSRIPSSDSLSPDNDTIGFFIAKFVKR